MSSSLQQTKGKNVKKKNFEKKEEKRLSGIQSPTDIFVQ